MTPVGQVYKVWADAVSILVMVLNVLSGSTAMNCHPCWVLVRIFNHSHKRLCGKSASFNTEHEGCDNTKQALLKHSATQCACVLVDY